MIEILTEHESAVRLGAFAVVLAAMAAWEGLAPRRARAVPRLRRWPGNLGIVAINAVLVRLLFPTAVVGVALWAEAQGLGLFNRVAAAPWLALAASVIALDLVIYGQHVAFHYVAVLWRLHRMHHTDLDIDLTTGVRFHPVEILLSILLKFAAVLALGAPAAAVVLYEVLLNGASVFNHGNVRLPLRLDRVLRAVVVTPDMHRVHHSVIRRETDSNFGNFLSVWDRLFGTYRAQPERGHDAMTIGLPEFRDPGESRLDRLLLNPFRRAA
ncbi:MAG TPA: sterol desaturase family protein [Alphaproteobacteria bacterium]